jgi:hypothetical protein
MPRKTKIDDAAIYQCIESFAAEPSGLGYAVTIQRGSNPAVQHSPGCFVLDGADEGEIHAARVALTPAATEPSESVERRKANSVAQLRQSVLDRAELQIRLEQADEHIANAKRKAEAAGAPEREIAKALGVKPDPNRSGWRGLRSNG